MRTAWHDRFRPCLRDSSDGLKSFNSFKINDIYFATKVWMKKQNKFANFQSKIAVVNNLLGSCEYRTACHDPVREIIVDFHSIIVVVLGSIFLSKTK